MNCKIISETDKEVRVEVTIPPRIYDADECSLNSAQILETVKNSGLVKKEWKCTESPTYMSNLREIRRVGVCVFKKSAAPKAKAKKPAAVKSPKTEVRKSGDA